MTFEFQDHYCTDIRWFTLVRMLNSAFDLKSHTELFLEIFLGSVITTGCANKQKPGKSVSLWQLFGLKTALQGSFNCQPPQRWMWHNSHFCEQKSDCGKEV